MDAIISATTGYDQIQAQQEAQQERDRYRGLSADAPPLNQSFGAVVSFEKTDLMFVFMGIQTLLLLGIWLEVR